MSVDNAGDNSAFLRRPLGSALLLTLVEGSWGLILHMPCAPTYLPTVSPLTSAVKPSSAQLTSKGRSGSRKELSHLSSAERCQGLDRTLLTLSRFHLYLDL